MSRPANPEAMHGWLGHRHQPYEPGSPAHAFFRDIVALRFPKKEFFETLAVLDLARRWINPLGPVFELCAGHGFLGMLIACDPRPRPIVLLDRTIPPNRHRLRALMAAHAPNLRHRLEEVRGDVQDWDRYGRGTFIGVHACGAATDVLIRTALAVRARFVVVPCCIRRSDALRYGVERVKGFETEIDGRRLAGVRREGYRVRMISFDPCITPWNRVLIAWPEEEPESPGGGIEPGPLPFRLPPRRADAPRHSSH